MEKDDLIVRNGSPPPPSTLCSSSLPFSVDNHPRYQNRWCLPGNEETSADDCCDTEMAGGKRPWVFKLLEIIKRSRKERNQGSSCTEEDDSNGSMDQEIWQEFPQDLFEAVISRLPIATIFKFRTVCRKWNALIYSDSFSRCCSELPQTIPWFYTISHKNDNLGQVYDPSLYPIIPALPLAICFCRRSSLLPQSWLCEYLCEQPVDQSFQRVARWVLRGPVSLWTRNDSEWKLHQSWV